MGCMSTRLHNFLVVENVDHQGELVVPYDEYAHMQ